MKIEPQGMVIVWQAFEDVILDFSFSRQKKQYIAVLKMNRIPIDNFGIIVDM